MSRVPARVRALRCTPVPPAAERWRGAGPARRADLRATGLSVPSPATPGLVVPGCPTPLPAHSFARPRKPLETPGAWPGVPTPAKLTSRGQALPARATTPRPGGAGQSPAQDPPPASAASAGVELPQARLRLSRARACVTEGPSPTLGAPAGRRPRPQRPANAQSRLPQIPSGFSHVYGSHSVGAGLHESSSQSVRVGTCGLAPPRGGATLCHTPGCPASVSSCRARRAKEFGTHSFPRLTEVESVCDLGEASVL